MVDESVPDIADVVAWVLSGDAASEAEVSFILGLEVTP